MNDNRIAQLVHEQSRIGRRVILLLSYLGEKGPSTRDTLIDAFPGGVKGELLVAKRQCYVGKNADGLFYIKPKGREVLRWLVLGDPQPAHWVTWEQSARVKQSGRLTFGALKKKGKRKYETRRLHR